jgi:hypothetical protein
MRRADCPSAPLGTLRLALAPRYLACCCAFRVSLTGSCSGRNSQTPPGPVVTRFPRPGVCQGDRGLSHVPALPLGSHAPLVDPGGVLRPRPPAPRTAAFRPLETVGVPRCLALSVSLWSTTIPFSGLDHAACLRMPSSSVRPLLGVHVEGTSALLARLWSGGTCAGARTHWVPATHCMRWALHPKVSDLPWRDPCLVRHHRSRTQFSLRYSARAF